MALLAAESSTDLDPAPCLDVEVGLLLLVVAWLDEETVEEMELDVETETPMAFAL